MPTLPGASFNGFLLLMNFLFTFIYFALNYIATFILTVFQIDISVDIPI